MGSSENETVDDKKVGKDVDETLNINLNDSLAEGEAKGPPLSRPGDGEAKRSTEDGELNTMDKGNVTKGAIDKTISAAEEQIPSENVAEIPDVKSAETFLDDAGKASIDGNVQENATSVSVNGIHNEREDVKLKSKDNVDEGPVEVTMDVDSKENEASQLHLLDEKKPSPAKLVRDDKAEDDESGKAVKHVATEMGMLPPACIKEEMAKPKVDEDHETSMNTPSNSFLVELSSVEGYESGTEEEQAAFAKDVKTFYRENNLEYKAPKFYKEEVKLLKLWRAVIKLGGYEQVTTCKLWRQVGESFKPPKTCTTVSWTFRTFYEKALLEYEKHKMHKELPFSDDSMTKPIGIENQAAGSQALGSGRARRDAAARAMQGWHSQRLLDNGEVCQPIIKDKNLNSTLKSEKQLKTNGVLKRKKPSNVERAVLVPHMKTMRPQMDSMVIDIGPQADWVKINVQRTNDCFEIYALVPGLLREEVHVQSDPAGRLIISGQPEQLDNPWGVTPFKKVVSLPSRIDPHQTSAVVTLHGQLFVRVPFEQSDI